MKLFFTILLLLNVSLSYSQELTADANTSLLLHFNNSVNGAAGEMPLSSSNISYASGMHGNALQISSNTTLRFDTTQNLNPKQGTIEFWVKLSTGENTTALEMGVGGGLAVQVGYWTRMLFNIGGINGNPEGLVLGNNTIWSLNKWYHLAFTWENRVGKIYYNGSLAFENTIGFDFPNVNLSFFNIGSTGGGGGQMQGLLDEFRISNRARTAQEIRDSYIKGLGGINNLAIINNSQISLYETWNLYLMKRGFYKVPVAYSVKPPGDTLWIGNNALDWTISNAEVAKIDNGILTATKNGNTTLTGTLNSFSVSIPLQVVSPILQPEKVTVDPFLVTPALCNTITVPVIAIIYLPTPDGINLNTSETAFLPISQQTVSEAKKHVLRINLHTKFSLEEGSKFRGYSNSNANPYLGYKIVDYIYVYEPLPRGFPTNLESPEGYFFADYNQIMSRFNGSHYINDLGVKEIWLFGYHTGEMVPVESNMSSPTTWDISNSSSLIDDLPIYSKTYILYNYNYTRGGNEATHNHGHQIESMVDYVANKQDGNANLFSREFRGYTVSGQGPLNRCGDTHHPPNSRIDYDYNNSTLVASDIKDWKPGGGTTTMVNGNTWGSVNYQWPSALYPALTPGVESNWYIFWMQSLPGNGNQIPYGSKWMTNWLRFLADWDSTTVKIGLYQNTPESNVVCNSFISTSLNSPTVCVGSPFSINYLVNGLALNTGNIFTVQLSNATGSFSNPISIGTLSGVSTSGTINVTIPSETITGNNYLIRTVSSNLAFTGSVSAAFSIKSLPSTPTISAGTTTTFCTGGGVTLTSNASSGNQWHKDGVAINGSTETTLNVIASGSYTTKATLSGCESASSNAIAVTVNSIPSTPVITAGTTTLCTGGSVTITSNATSGNQWYKDGIAINSSTGTTLNVIASGSYTTKITLNGCESVTSNSITITVNAIPQKPTISRNGADMISSAASGNHWFIDRVSINGALSPTYRPTASGQVSVQVTVNNCISPMSDNYYFLITGITDPTALDNFIHIFPNPVTNKLSIVSSYQHPLQIRIFDIAGHSFLKLTKASGNIEIDMSRYTAGSYLLEIKDSKSSKSYRKIIIKHY